MRKFRTNTKMIRKALAVVLTAAIILPLFMFTACDSRTELRVAIWDDYLDPDVIAMFEAEFPHIKIREIEMIDNESLHTLMSGEGVRYDLIFPSDYMVERMAAENMLAQIDWSRVPNLSNVGERFTHLEYDPQNLYSVPYKWGTFGILYNPVMLADLGFGDDEVVDSWDILWDTRFEGQIYMYEIARESFIPALQRLGFSANTTNTAELEAARDSLIVQADLVQTHVGTDGIDKMVGEEGALALIYNGYAFWAKDENPNLEFALPKEGGMLWYDCIAIPANGQNKAYAEEFINFLLRPDVAAMNSEYSYYSTPNMAALELMDEEWQEDPVYWPPEEDIKDAEVLRHLGTEVMQRIETMWTQILVSFG